MKAFFMNCTTLSPSEFKEHLQHSTIFYRLVETPAGTLASFETEKGIFKAIFIDKNQKFPEYTKKDGPHSETLLLVGTEFQCQVWEKTFAIPTGTTTSYETIAQSLDNPKAYRAVAQALASNAIAYFIPCHRVIGKNGSLSGYAWGVERKKKLLEAEKSS